MYICIPKTMDIVFHNYYVHPIAGKRRHGYMALELVVPPCHDGYSTCCLTSLEQIIDSHVLSFTRYLYSLPRHVLGDFWLLQRSRGNVSHTSCESIFTKPQDQLKYILVSLVCVPCSPSALKISGRFLLHKD